MFRIASILLEEQICQKTAQWLGLAFQLAGQRLVANVWKGVELAAWKLTEDLALWSGFCFADWEVNIDRRNPDQ